MYLNLANPRSLENKFKVLDHGYVRLINFMGRDEDIIESARMSTGKGFYGWHWEKDTYASHICLNCKTHHLEEELFRDDETQVVSCSTCWSEDIKAFSEISSTLVGDPKLRGRKGEPRDLSLLEFLYMNRHMTPYEMGELCIEVKAPIMVFREWQRHRTQGYNEFSARYSQMPNEHYMPELRRFQKQSAANKQGSAEAMDEDFAVDAHNQLVKEQDGIYTSYENMVRAGLAKEVARINTPVSRYSKMRAKTDVRNWLGFLALRMEKSAQWEIRQYANIVGSIIREIWPKTFALFVEHDLLSVRFSRTEMKVLRAMYQQVMDKTMPLAVPGMTEKKMKALLDKLIIDREAEYADVEALKGV